MKHFIPLLAVGFVALTCGCATNYIVEWKAKPHHEFDKAQQQDVQVPGRPAYYALAPFSVPFDIVTAPVQLCVLLAWPAAKTPQLNRTNEPTSSLNSEPQSRQ